MNGWVTVTCHCEECGHTWAENLQIDWDGSPIPCRMCGELAVEVGA